MNGVNHELAPPVNHVFVDFENVHELALGIIGNKGVSITLLLGPAHKRLDVPLVEKMLEHADSVQLVRITSGGKNALDFTLSYYVGRAVAADPTGSFHIISKDTGYDPLIKHLRSKHINAQRHDDYSTLPFASPENLPTLTQPAVAPKQKAQTKPESHPRPEPMTQVLGHLHKASAKGKCPRSQKTLLSFVVAHVRPKIKEAEVKSVVEKLREAGYIAMDEKGIVTYHLGIHEGRATVEPEVLRKPETVKHTGQ